MATNVIREIIKITDDAESPQSWRMWAAMAAISAVVGRKVYKNMGGVYTVYPNLYIMIVGDSGLRKSLPVDIVDRLVRGVGNARVISGRNSVQSIISDLSRVETRPDGKDPIKEAHAAIISEEFGSLLIKDDQSDIILTTLFDQAGRKEWINTTKKDGREKLIYPYITIFGASNQTHLRLALDRASITGGLIGRFIFVEAFKRHKHNPLTDDAPLINYDPAIKALEEISKYEGEFVWSKEGKEVFDSFYQDIGKKIDTGQDTTGTINRLHVKVLKVAMIIALSEGHGLILQKEDIEHAIKACVEHSGTKIWSGVGIGEDSHKIAMLMQTLRQVETGELTNRQILQRHYGDFNALDLNRMIETLVVAGLVATGKKGTEAAVRITPEGWAFIEGLGK